jgi:hypothetical protein
MKMDFKNWNSVDIQPRKDVIFVAKLKDKDSFIMGQMLSENGWLATPYMDIKYWTKAKDVFEYWFDVKNIGQ